MGMHGHVKNGVIVLDNGARLPEGAEVSVVELSRTQSLASTASGAHSVLAIPPVSLGEVLRPLADDDDLLNEMLEGRS